MSDFLRIVTLPTIISIVVCALAHPSLVRIALLKDIVDRPNARKLNSRPIPVLGGIGVFLGLMFGVCLAVYYVEGMEIPLEVIVGMIITLFVGVSDDILDLSPRTRFLAQIFTICLMMFVGGGYIMNNFHGLWGIHELPWGVAVALTLVSCVGIINAINLIDGVDGLCSGYGMFASLLFATLFLRMGDVEFAVLALSMFGALVPFCIHNVFGHKSKMFLGDGGSLMVGFVCSLFVVRVVQMGDDVVTGSNIALTLAILAVPVFDTLRVMTARMLQRRSPFSPDKTHLHHMFIRLGFSHVITALNVIALNGLVVVIWHLCNVWNFTPEVQLYVTSVSGILFTTGLYYGVEYIERSHPVVYAKMQNFVEKYSIRRSGFLLKLQQVLDGGE